MTDQPTNEFVSNEASDVAFDESLLSAYLDQELSFEERSLVELRLSQDAELRKTCEDLQQIRQWIKSTPLETASSKPIRGEWDSPSRTIDAAVLKPILATDNSGSQQSSIDRAGLTRRTWWNLGSLAASLLGIVTGIYLLPTVLQNPTAEIAKAIPKKVSPAVASENKPLKREDVSELSMQFAAPIPEETAAAPLPSMAPKAAVYSPQDADAIQLSELPPTTVFIQARRSSQSQLNMQSRRSGVAANSYRSQANTPSTAPPQVVDSPAQKIAQLPASDPNLIEAVMPRSQIAMFLIDNQLDKLVEDEISPATPERSAYVQDKLSRQRSSRSVQQYLGSQLDGVALENITPESKIDSKTDSKMNDRTIGSLSNGRSQVRESTDTLKPLETGENDDWIHVVIEVVP